MYYSLLLLRIMLMHNIHIQSEVYTWKHFIHFVMLGFFYGTIFMKLFSLTLSLHLFSLTNWKAYLFHYFWNSIKQKENCTQLDEYYLKKKFSCTRLLRLYIHRSLNLPFLCVCVCGRADGKLLMDSEIQI